MSRMTEHYIDGGGNIPVRSWKRKTKMKCYCVKCETPLYFEVDVPVPQVCRDCLEVNDRERRTGAHVLQMASATGWNDDGEGALEFLLRRAREVAIEDCVEKPAETP